MLYVDDITDWQQSINQVVCGDCMQFVRKLPDQCVDVICTSPPYWQQRDYECSNQMGLEPTFIEYIDKMCLLFDECRRVLKKDGHLWVNMGDCYNENAGGFFDNEKNDNPAIGKHRLKVNKYQSDYPRRSLLMIPYRFSIKMIDDYNWLCRNLIIWRKVSCQPTTAENRFTIDFEPFFLFTKTQKYKFNIEAVKWMQDNDDNCFPAVKERRSVWDIDTERSRKTGHKAMYPIELAEVPIMAGCDAGGVVLDPFMGSGSTALAAKRLGARYIGCELNPKTCQETNEGLAT